MKLTLEKVQKWYRCFSEEVVTNRLLKDAVLPETVLGKERDILEKHLLPGKTIDLGCGFGRFFQFLLEQGQEEVVGVDSCSGSTEEIRQKFEGRSDVKVVFAKMQEWDFFPDEINNQRFQNLLCLGNAFGGFFSAPEQESFGSACLRLAAPGSRLFIDKIRVAKHFARLFTNEVRFDLFEAENQTHRGFGLISFWPQSETPLVQYYPSQEEIERVFSPHGFELMDKGRVEENWLEARDLLVFQKK